MTAPFLDLANLSVALGGKPVLSDVTAGFSRGELVALVGPNGAGKSTLLRAIAHLQRAQGRIALQGVDLSTTPPARRARLVGYLPQGHQTHWPLPVRDIVALGRFPHGATDPRRLTLADGEAVEAAMRQTGVLPLADRPATRLSGGERARVALARVLALGAPLILADEPTASLDPRYQLEVMELLAGVAGRGALVIAATHDLGHADRYAHRVLALDSGRVAAFGPPAEALSAAVLERVFRVRALSASKAGERLLSPWESLP